MTDTIEIDPKTRTRIREKILEAEKKQLHLDRPHNIIPEIMEIIEAEVDEVDYAFDGGSE
ncbi:hypothetical protein [Haladaptatus sp. ZSTT2]|uniref:hypothetical protein n=1 Tax=Haladaptatus sp. ZSTT2 TaxID=3120515 RepID=UPI00300EEF93